MIFLWTTEDKLVFIQETSYFGEPCGSPYMDRVTIWEIDSPKSWHRVDIAELQSVNQEYLDLRGE